MERLALLAVALLAWHAAAAAAQGGCKVAIDPSKPDCKYYVDKYFGGDWNQFGTLNPSASLNCFVELPGRPFGTLPSNSSLVVKCNPPPAAKASPPQPSCAAGKCHRSSSSRLVALPAPADPEPLEVVQLQPPSAARCCCLPFLQAPSP
jgi:hypothetical protein